MADVTDRSFGDGLLARVLRSAGKWSLFAIITCACWHGAAQLQELQPAVASDARRSDYRLLRQRDPTVFLNLVEQLTPVDRSDADGLTLLHVAAIDGNVAAAERLLARGADVNRRHGILGPPLAQALMMGDVELARLLIRHGADPSAVGDSWDITPLQAALNSGRADGVRLLLSMGVDPMPAGVWNNPLNGLTADEEIDTVCLLLRAGVDPNRAGGNGELPLVTAAAFGTPSAVATFIAGGADPALRDAKGQTALTIARGRPEVLAVLRRASDDIPPAACPDVAAASQQADVFETEDQELVLSNIMASERHK